MTLMKNVNGVQIEMNEAEIAEYNAIQQQWIDEAPERVRKHRDSILESEVDPISSNALRWASMTAEQQQAWADYRQALLDIPQQSGFPHDVVWPTKP